MNALIFILFQQIRKRVAHKHSSNAELATGIEQIQSGSFYSGVRAQLLPCYCKAFCFAMCTPSLWPCDSRGLLVHGDESPGRRRREALCGKELVLYIYGMIPSNCTR